MIVINTKKNVTIRPIFIYFLARPDSSIVPVSKIITNPECTQLNIDTIPGH